MRTLLIAEIHKDNAWLDEWVRHHLEFGISDIVLFDTNVGKEDYPMSDYIINMCSSKKIKIQNFRNQKISIQIELSKFDWNQYDYCFWLNTNEYIKSKMYDNINDALKDEDTNLLLRIYPYNIENGIKKLDTKNFYTYGERTLNKTNNTLCELTNKLYIEKFPNRTEEDWKKYILVKNERS